MAETKIIGEFRGEYRFLSNFYASPIVHEGLEYTTVEHLFQTLKTLNPRERERVRRAGSARQAKSMGRRVTLRADWGAIRVKAMHHTVELKFRQNPDLLHKLLATGDAVLEEGNSWGDTFWGVSSSTRRGCNYLGTILQDIRDLLRADQQRHEQH